MSSGFQTSPMSDSERKRIASVQHAGVGDGACVDELIEMLTDPSWVVRRAVVDAIVSVGIPAVEPLCKNIESKRDNESQIAAAVDALVGMRVAVENSVLKLTRHPDPAVISDAVQVLGRRRSQSSISTLIQLTKHENDNVAVAAIEALGRIGGRSAVEALINTIEAGNFFRTFPAIDVLGRSGDPRVVEPLTRLLSQSTYLPEAARALGRTGEKAAVKPLLSLLHSPSHSVVRIAVVSLWDLRGRFEDKSGENGQAIDQVIRTQLGSKTVRKLVQIGADADEFESFAICKLLGILESSESAAFLATKLDGPIRVAECAAETLKKIGRDADEILRQVIREGSSARRRVVLPVVIRSSAASVVAECLADQSSDVRALACETLGRLGDTSVVGKIFDLLGDQNQRVVHSATAAIQALGSRESRELARHAAKSENPNIRRSAIRILSYFGDSNSLQPILEGLSDVNHHVREAALQGLPFLEDTRAIEALIEATKNASARIRGLAMRSVGQVPKPSERIYSVLLKGLKDSDSWVRYYACQSLGRLTYKPALSEIAKLIHDEAGQVRVAAIEALSHLNSAEAHESLMKIAASEEVEAKRAALIGLGIYSRLEALPVVLNAIQSSDASTRLIALSAVVNFRTPIVLDALKNAALDSNEQVSAAAIGFLGARNEKEATQILVHLLASEPTRERAKTALLIPGEERVGELLIALESANDEMATLLISILSKLERTEAKPALVSAMKLKNAAARKAAASGLAARHSLEALNVLQEASENDPDSEVRQICSILLRE